MKKNATSVMALGGLGQIGMNLLLIQHNNEYLIIDSGIGFPDNNAYGIELLIPNLEMLESIREQLKGVLITHGHEDHIGGLGFLCQKSEAPIYCSQYTKELILAKTLDFPVLNWIEINEVPSRKRFTIGSFTIEPYDVCHSIPGAFGYYIKTPTQSILHTGDFRIDDNPVLDNKTDLQAIECFGKEGVTLLMADSTNVSMVGNCPSEASIEPSILNIISKSKGLCLATCFATNTARVKQLLNIAVELNKKVCIIGTSMIKQIEIAKQQQKIMVDDNLFIRLDEFNKHPRDSILVISTGSQGEYRSALRSISSSEHRTVKLQKEDLVIFSSKVIPGNEKSIAYLYNHILKTGALVIHEKSDLVHVSGHAYQEGLKKVIQLARPTYFMPVHGEYSHLIQHAKMAQDLGIAENHTIVAENGEVVEFDNESIQITKKIEVGIQHVESWVTAAGNYRSEIIDDESLKERRFMGTYGVVSLLIQLDKLKLKIKMPVQIEIKGMYSWINSPKTMNDLNNLLSQAFSPLPEDVTDENLKEISRVTVRRYFKTLLAKKPLIFTHIIWI